MKKKLTINSLALGNLKQRRKQYTILIIGIILAIVFSSGTLFFISCNKASNEEYQRRTAGNFYYYYYNPFESFDIEAGVKDGYIEKYGYTHILGYAYTDEEKKDRGTLVAWLDDNAKDLYYVALKEGKYPENKGEIALESDAALRLGLDAKVGEKISLSMLNANGTDFSTTAMEKTYTIVGILTDKRKNIELFGENAGIIPAAFVSDEEDVDIGGKEILALFFNPTEKSNNRTIIIDGYESTPFYEYFMPQIYENSGGQNLIGRVPAYNSDLSLQNSSILTVTLTVVLMIASCIGIINAFSTNLQERRKQIGMLRAVGATKRQIINIFGRETFIIALICAPIGVAISYFGVKLFATIMGEDYIFIPDMKVLFGSAGVSVICVMLAALIPLFKASKISPMQAIRNVELNRKMSRQKIKTEKEFNVPKLLAKRSIKFYKAKQIGVSIILALTIFMSCLGLSVIKTEMNNSWWSNHYSSDYIIKRYGLTGVSLADLNFTVADKKISLNAVQDIIDYPLFSDVYGYKNCVTYLPVDEYSDYMLLTQFISSSRYSPAITDFTRSDFENLNFDEIFDVWFTGEYEFYNELKQKSGTQQELYQMKMYGLDQQVIEKHSDEFEVIDGKIDIEKLNSGEEIILVASNENGLYLTFDKDGRNSSYGVSDTTSSGEKDMYTSATLEYKAGDTINLRTINSDVVEYSNEVDNWIPDDLTVYDKEVKIGAIIKPFDFDEFHLYSEGEMRVMTTSIGIDKIAGYQVDYSSLFIKCDGELDDNSDALATDFLYSLISIGDTTYDVKSGYAEDQETQAWLKTLVISLLAIVILFFSICASIVNNALTAKIRESKKEIGTLRAVGASVKEITSSYVRQLISMFSWGCGIGFMGYTITHIIIRLLNKEFGYTFEIWPAVIICVLLFSMCSLNLYLKIRKEMKNSIVDNIREL